MDSKILDGVANHFRGEMTSSKAVLFSGGLLGIITVVLFISAFFMLDEQYCPPEYRDAEESGGCDIVPTGPDVDEIIFRWAFSLGVLLPISVSLMSYSLLTQRDSKLIDDGIEPISNPRSNLIKSLFAGLGAGITAIIGFIILVILFFIFAIIWVLLNGGLQTGGFP
tara:strand:+ start:128 stop:628 length:501 start_codon:yes stop_codon:yes gene_type:complete